jgi:tRNA pseudouridine55 synthase
MRSLARDLAAALGTVGHVAALRRLRVGPFTDGGAVPLDKLLALGQDPAALSFVLPVETALADIPALALTGEEAARLTNGQALSLIPFLARMPQDADPDGGLVRVMAGGKALALGRLGEGMLHPVRLLSHA